MDDSFSKIKAGISNKINIPDKLILLCEWYDNNKFPISGNFDLYASDGKDVESWLGFNDLNYRLGIFGIGKDGSFYAFWNDDYGKQKIVHLGIEGGELYILANNFIDFLRLLAIGYDEIGFANLSLTVQEWNALIGEESTYGINVNFQDWVVKSFNAQIPKRGNEISNLEDKKFENWISLNTLKFNR